MIFSTCCLTGTSQSYSHKIYCESQCSQIIFKKQESSGQKPALTLPTPLFYNKNVSAHTYFIHRDLVKKKKNFNLVRIFPIQCLEYISQTLSFLGTAECTDKGMNVRHICVCVCIYEIIHKDIDKIYVANPTYYIMVR